jgi:cytochrome P450
MSFYNEIYANNSRRRDKSKLWFWMAGMDGFGGRATFMTIEHDLHRLRRAAFGQYFSKGKMLELQPRVVEKVVSLRENMLKWAGREELLELMSAMSALTLGE